MQDSALHTINISVPDDIIYDLTEIYEYIDSRFENLYPYKNNWEPHIDLYTMRVKEENSNKYINELEKVELPNINLKIDLTSFSISNDQKYIFIEFSDDTRKQILELRSFIDKNFGKYKDLDIPNYFLEKWYSYTKEQQDRIKKTGSLHEYSPHISLIKLNPKDTLPAFKQITSRFQPVSYSAKSIYLNIQTFNESDMFKTMLVKELIK